MSSNKVIYKNKIFSLCLVFSLSIFLSSALYAEPQSSIKFKEIHPTLQSSEPSARSLCEDVQTVPTEDQCQFVLDTCKDEKIGFLDYLPLYYCHHKKLSVALYTFLLGVLFTTLGVTASDFLCPNLSSISKVFHIPDNLAGVTLLGFGNGAPDVFSNYTAMSIGAGSLAIAELMGAALFITSVVVGCMCIVQPFEVPRKAFLRDVGFFGCAVILLIVFVSDGNLSQTECVVMICLYVVYVIFVFCWHWITSGRRLNDILHKRARDLYIDEDEEGFQIGDDEDFIDNSLLEELPSIYDIARNAEVEEEFAEWQYRNDRMLSNSKVNGYSEILKNVKSNSGTESMSFTRPSLTDTIEFSSLLSRLKKSQGFPSIGDAHLRPSTEPNFRNNHLQYQSPITSEPAYHIPFRDNVCIADNNPQELDNNVRGELATSLHTVPFSRDSQSHLQSTFSERQPFVFHSHTFWGKSQRWFNECWKNPDIRFWVKLLFPEYQGFENFEVLRQIYMIALVPFMLFLRVTIPVRIFTESSTITLHDESDLSPGDFQFLMNGDDKGLILLQSFFSPLTVAFFTFSESNFLWVSVITLFLSVSLTLTVKFQFQTGKKSFDHLINVLFAFIGFASAISWISFIATEVVGILKAVSIIYHLSDAILGLTVFAIGNSLGDLIANFTIAKMGMPRMAFGACFGGPILSLCSLGFSGLLTLNNKQDPQAIEKGYELFLSPTLIVSCVALVLSTTFTVIAVFLNNWTMDKRIGYVLISIWGIATSVGIIIEIQ